AEDGIRDDLVTGVQTCALPISVDGRIIEGIASVNEAAITGESAPVIRESGGDRSSVTGGTQVLSDWMVVEVRANPGEAFLDRMKIGRASCRERVRSARGRVCVE